LPLSCGRACPLRAAPGAGIDCGFVPGLDLRDVEAHLCAVHRSAPSEAAALAATLVPIVFGEEDAIDTPWTGGPGIVGLPAAAVRPGAAGGGGPAAPQLPPPPPPRTFTCTSGCGEIELRGLGRPTAIAHHMATRHGIGKFW
jgi:hypothetical protein